MRKALVHIGGVAAGTLEETAAGFRYRYDPRYLARPDAVAASLTLPLRQEPFDSPHLFAFFEGLLAEGSLRSLQSRLLRIDEEDSFGLLLSPAYDLLDTKLHIPSESPFALDFFADDHETEAFLRNGFHSGPDFLELARRFGMGGGRASKILRSVEVLSEKAEPIARASLLSPDARDLYLATVRDRARAVLAGW